MSVDDFQTKYTPVMESIVKGAIAETTKLFENMVGELRAEMSKIKKENEALKIRCSLFENGQIQANISTRGQGPPTTPSVSLDKRDAVVQCDLVPLYAFLEEKCQQTGPSSLQSQKDQHQKGVYGLLITHDYEAPAEGNSQKTIVLVKPEEEETVPAVVRKEAMGDDAYTQMASACGVGQEGSLLSLKSSGGNRKREETEMPVDLPCLGMDRTFLREHMLSTDSEPSCLMSVGNNNGVMQTSVIGENVSGVKTQNESLVAYQRLTKAEPHEKEHTLKDENPGKKQSSIILQQCARKDMASRKEVVCQESICNEWEPSTRPQLQSAINTSYQEIKNCPSITQGHDKKSTLSNDAKATGSHECGPLCLSVVSLETGMETASEYQQIYMEMEDQPDKAPYNGIPSALKLLNSQTVVTPQVPKYGLSENSFSVSLQDAVLQVEARNQSSVEKDATGSSGAQFPTNIVTTQHRYEIIPSFQQAFYQPPTNTCKKTPLYPFPDIRTIIQKTTDLVCPSEVSSVLSKVAAVQKKKTPASTFAGLYTPPPSTVSPNKIDIKSRKYFPINFERTDKQSETQPYPKRTNVVPRQVRSKAPVSQSFIPRKIEASSPPPTISVSSPLQVGYSKQLTKCKDIPLDSDEESVSSEVEPITTCPVLFPEHVCSSQQIPNNQHVFLTSGKETDSLSAGLEHLPQMLSPRLGRSSQQIKTPLTAKEGVSSAEPVPISICPVAQPAIEQKLSPVVRLKRLPLSISTNESILVSELLSVRPTSMFKVKRPSQPALSNTVCSTEGNDCSKKTRSNSSRNSRSRLDQDSPEMTTSLSLSSRRCKSIRENMEYEIADWTVSPRRSCQSKKCTIPRMSSGQPATPIHGKYTFSQNDCCPKQMKRTDTVAPSTMWPDLAKDDVRLRETTDPTLKEPRLAKIIAKIKNSSQPQIRNGIKMTHLKCTDFEAQTKTKAQAILTPSEMSAGKTTLLDERSVLLTVQKPMTSSKSQNYTRPSPTDVAIHPIYTPRIVSAIQPLAVIGQRLLKNQCGECGRVLSSSAALESHVSLHTGHRPYSCTLCGKSFPDSKGLRRHGRVHRNGRIHICHQCGKGFVYRFGLTKHLQMVHVKFKPFVCQICSKAFFTERDVETHIRVHTGEKPFNCNLCEKKFKRRVELNVHLRWHNGEKRHWCPYCGKGFLDYNNLKRHKYIHTGEKPHSCPHCIKQFTQSGHLKKHIKNVHKIQ